MQTDQSEPEKLVREVVYQPQLETMRLSARTSAGTIMKYRRGFLFSIRVAKLINYKLGSAGGHLCHHTGRTTEASQQKKANGRVLMIFYLRTWTQPCLQPRYSMYIPVI